MRKGIQARRRKNAAIVLSLVVLIELGVALFFVVLHFISLGSASNLSPTDLVPTITALACIGVGAFAWRRFYAILVWKGPRQPKREKDAKKGSGETA